jgi:hypothetical protein
MAIFVNPRPNLGNPEVKMRDRICFISFLILPFIILGCAKRNLVSYERIERTNYVQIRLNSGKTVQGTVFKIEPHQITLLEKERTTRIIAKSSILSAKRKSPVYDDFGNGISEEEIRSVQSNKNSLIYGIGGGFLSTGVSFFLGSLASKDASSGGTILAATTVAGGGLGTAIFVHAGKAKDRRVAIEKIREKRRSMDIRKTTDKKKSPSTLQKQLEEEKKKQEELRKQREKLLKELQKKKK